MKKSKKKRKEERRLKMLKANKVKKVEKEICEQTEDTANVSKLEEVTIIENMHAKDIGVDTNISMDETPELKYSPKIEIPRSVYYKLMAYTKLVKDEISGLGYVEKISPYRFRVTDIYLTKQIVTGGSCKLDVDDRVKLMQHLIEQGKNPGLLKLWWHSHNSMGTGWSGTDEETGKTNVCDYLLSIVVNNNSELRAKLHIYQPIAVIIDNIKVVMTDNEPVDDIISQCKAKIKEKVFKERCERSIDYVDTKYPMVDTVHFPGRCNTSQVRGNNEAQDIKEPKNNTEVESLFDPPYDEHFSTGNFRFSWNKHEYCYDVYDGSGHKVRREELDRLGLTELAFPFETELTNIGARV